MHPDVTPVRDSTDIFKPVIDTIVFCCEEEAITPDLDSFTDASRTLIIRTPANTVPLHGETTGSARLFAEHISEDRRVSRIIVRGHAQCTLLQQLVASPVGSPEWWQRCRKTRRNLSLTNGSLPDEQRLAVCTYDNVVEQLRNLLSHPPVLKRCTDGSMRVLGWVYDADYNWISVYDPEADTFVPPNAIPDMKPKLP